MKEPEGQELPGQWRFAEWFPRPVRVHVVSDLDACARGFGLEIERVPGLLQATDVIGRVARRLARQPHRIERDVGHLQTLDLWNRHLLSPSEAPSLDGLPDPERRACEEHERDGNQHRRPAPGLFGGPSQLRMGRVEVFLERSRIRVAGVRTLGEAPIDNRLDVGRQVRAQAAQCRRLVSEDSRDQPEIRVAGERPAARKHFVEHGAEREDVRPCRHRLAFGLLRRHVGRRAHDQSRPGVEPGHRFFGLIALDQLRKAEIEYFCATVAGDQDVRGLDIAVHDAAAVRGVERRGDLGRVLERRRDRHRPLRNQPVQPRAVHQLHRDERRPIVLVDVVDGDDVRVVERRSRTGFLDEAALAIGIGRRFGRQHLYRDRASEPGVVGGVNDAHTAAADFCANAVVRNLFVGHQGWIIAGAREPGSGIRGQGSGIVRPAGFTQRFELSARSFSDP